MWQRDFPGMYETLQKEWSEPYKDIMAAVLGGYTCSLIHFIDPFSSLV